MKNEPVAWMNSKGDIILPAHQANKEYNIPLYTHPVKELTDEEIMTTYTEHSTYGYGQRLYINVYGFARAILRKAQEK
jgi:hypothetical protein